MNPVNGHVLIQRLESCSSTQICGSSSCTPFNSCFTSCNEVALCQRAAFSCFCVCLNFQTLGTLFFSNTVSVDIAGKSWTDTNGILSSGSLSSPAAKLFFSSLQSRGHPALRLHQTSTLHPCLCNLFLFPPSHALPFCSSLCVPSCTATLPRSSIERSFRPLSSSLFGSKVLLLRLRCHGPSNSTRSSVQAVAEFSTIIAVSLEPLSSLSTFPSFSSLVGLQRHQLPFNLVHSSSMPPASSPAPRASFKALTLASNASTSIGTGLSCFPLSSK